jgi:hypothetical protein
VQSTINTGSVGIAPGTSITGNYRLLAGEEEINSHDAIQCSDDLHRAYGYTQNAICRVLQTSDLAGKSECGYSISCLLYWNELNPISS